MKIGIYRHYKGGLYRVHGTCLHSETKEELVLYESLNGDDLTKYWVRPKEMFFEEVELLGQRISRFTYIGDQKARDRI